MKYTHIKYSFGIFRQQLHKYLDMIWYTWIKLKSAFPFVKTSMQPIVHLKCI